MICSLAAALILPGVSGASLLAASGGGSAVDQYKEHTPTSKGSKPVNTSKTAKTVKPTPQVARALNRVTNSKARGTIMRIATDPGFGASIGKIPAVKTPATGHADSSFGRSLGAIITSPGAGSAGRLAVLLGVILATTVAVGISAVRKQRV